MLWCEFIATWKVFISFWSTDGNQPKALCDCLEFPNFLLYHDSNQFQSGKCEITLRFFQRKTFLTILVSKEKQESSPQFQKKKRFHGSFHVLMFNIWTESRMVLCQRYLWRGCRRQANTSVARTPSCGRNKWWSIRSAFATTSFLENYHLNCFAENRSALINICSMKHCLNSIDWVRVSAWKFPASSNQMVLRLQISRGIFANLRGALVRGCMCCWKSKAMRKCSSTTWGSFLQVDDFLLDGIHLWRCKVS